MQLAWKNKIYTWHEAWLRLGGYLFWNNGYEAQEEPLTENKGRNLITSSWAVLSISVDLLWYGRYCVWVNTHGR
jgi:hypothetical protein